MSLVLGCVQPRKCESQEINYKRVWMETERGKKRSLQRARIADELLYKREEQKLIVLSQIVAICPN